MNGKIKYIAGEIINGNWEKLDLFRAKLEGVELAMCIAAWETRRQVVNEAQQSINMTYRFKEKIKLPGKPKEEIMRINNAPDFMSEHVNIYKQGDTIDSKNRKQKFHEYYQDHEAVYEINRSDGMHLLGSLFWITTAGNAQAEDITKVKPSAAKHIGIETFGNELGEELDMVEEEVIIEGYNATQKMILETIQEKVIAFIGKDHGDYEKWDEVYTIREVGEEFFQLQELLMQNFPDPLDAMKVKEMKIAKEEIEKKKEGGDGDGDDIW